MALWESPILDSAYKHGYSDGDIRWALRHFIAQADDPHDDDVTLFLGPNIEGDLIEVGVLATDEGPLVIHAMRGRLTRFFPRTR